MKSLLILNFALALTATSLAAQAQTYQWKDANGRTFISDTPPPGTKAQRSAAAPSAPVAATASGAAGKSAEAAPTASPPAQKSVAELNLEFKKRQQEAREKADKEAKEQAARAENQESCERARRSLTALQNGQPMAQLNEKGESQLLDNNQREQEMERARRFVSEACR